MQNFDIIVESPIQKTYRSQVTVGTYDITDEKITERFTGCIDIEKEADWSIGIIYGNSGTGKSTIAREVFGEEYIYIPEHHNQCVLDDFPKNLDIKTIHQMLISVGFSSPPSWLKPYSVLSTGEKMRVDLAMALLSDRDIVVFDEYTSVVDRTVAKIGSMAVAKSIRRTKKKFVAVSCHSDIIEWLQPDWEFCTNNMSFLRRSHRRPKIELSIYETKGYWPMFSKYHYLAHNMNNASKQYVAFYENVPVAITCVLPQCGQKNMYREHRTVTHPDYQGVGIGSTLSDFIAQKYVSSGKRYRSVTSNPAFIKHREKSPNWILVFSGRNGLHSIRRLGGAGIRKVTAWEYVINDDKKDKE